MVEQEGVEDGVTEAVVAAEKVAVTTGTIVDTEGGGQQQSCHTPSHQVHVGRSLKRRRSNLCFSEPG